MSLLNMLLDGESSPPARRRRAVEESKGSQRNLVESLRKSARLGESMTLSRGEVRYLLKMVEEASSDPFSSGSVLDDGDLRTLGVETKEVGELYGLRDHEDIPKEEGEEAEAGELSSKQPIFGPESALVAPDCTPGGREDIPASVINSMKVLVGEEETEEYKREPEPQEPQAHRSLSWTQMRPQRREQSPEPPAKAVENVSPLAILKTTKALRESSKKYNSRRVVKKILTEEQRAAIAKLGGASDSLD
jgi:hypothetical protein